MKHTFQIVSSDFVSTTRWIEPAPGWKKAAEFPFLFLTVARNNLKWDTGSLQTYLLKPFISHDFWMVFDSSQHFL